jgi:hypothetical protein
VDDDGDDDGDDVYDALLLTLDDNHGMNNYGNEEGDEGYADRMKKKGSTN